MGKWHFRLVYCSRANSHGSPNLLAVVPDRIPRLYLLPHGYEVRRRKIGCKQAPCEVLRGFDPPEATIGSLGLSFIPQQCTLPPSACHPALPPREKVDPVPSFPLALRKSRTLSGCYSTIPLLSQWPSDPFCETPPWSVGRYAYM